MCLYTCIEGNQSQHLLIYVLLHTLRRYQGTSIGCAGVPAWSFCIVFYTLWGDISGPKLVALECRHEAFAFGFTRFEAISVHQSQSSGSARMKLSHRVLHALRRYQCTNVGCGGVPAWSFCIVFYTLWDDISTPKLVARECRCEAFALCFTHLEVILVSVHRSWLCWSAHMKLLHCVLHTLRRYQCTEVGCVGVPAWSFCIGFYTLWGDISALKSVARDCLHEAFASCFTCFEAMSVHQRWLRGSACMKLLHCVLHALRRYQCTKVGCAGVLAWSFCIVFYTLWVVTKLVVQECPHGVFALCFTRFEVISMHQRLWCGSAGMKRLHCVLYALRRYQCAKVGCAGVPVRSFCIVFYTLWGDISVKQSCLRGSARMELLHCVLHTLRRYQCTKVGCVGVPAWSFYIVFYRLWGDASETKLVAWECQYEAFASCFTPLWGDISAPSFSIAFYMLWGNIMHQGWLRWSPRMEFLHRVLHALRQYQSNKVGCAGVLAWSFCIVFYLRRYRCTNVGCAGVPAWIFCIVFTRFEAISVHQSGLHGSAGIKLLHCVLYALRRYQCNKAGCTGVPPWIFCIVFYTLWGYIRAPKLVARECQHEAFVLWFTRFEAISVHQSLLRRSPHMELLNCILHALRRYQCNKVGCAGVLAWSFCFVFYMLWGNISTPQLVVRKCRHEAFASCFTCSEVIPV